jgi:hypothetical protein
VSDTSHNSRIQPHFDDLAGWALWQLSIVLKEIANSRCASAENSVVDDKNYVGMAGGKSTPSRRSRGDLQQRLKLVHPFINKEKRTTKE